MNTATLCETLAREVERRAIQFITYNPKSKKNLNTVGRENLFYIDYATCKNIKKTLLHGFDFCACR